LFRDESIFIALDEKKTEITEYHMELLKNLLKIVNKKTLK